MYPDRLARPLGRSEGGFPGRQGRFAVQQLTQRGDGPPHPGVTGNERLAPACLRRLGNGWNLAQGQHKLGQITRRSARIGETVGARVLPFQPAVTLTGSAHLPRLRDRQWQVRSQTRQPVRLLLDLLNRPAEARQSDRKGVTQPVDGVVCAAGTHRTKGQARPLGKLRGQQTAHEVRAGVHLVFVHSAGGQVRFWKGHLPSVNGDGRAGNRPSGLAVLSDTPLSTRRSDRRCGPRCRRPARRPRLAK